MKTKPSYSKEIEEYILYGKILRPVLHDLVTPLTSLQGVFSLVNYKQLPPSQAQLISFAQQVLHQLYQIVENGYDLLEDSLPVERFWPVQSVVKVVRLLSSEFKKNNITLRYDIFPDDLPLTGSATLFERIILNLLTNSIAALQNKRGKRFITVITQNEPSDYAVTVKDNGPKLTPKAFHKPGTGLRFVDGIMRSYFHGWYEINREWKETALTLHFKV